MKYVQTGAFHPRSETTTVAKGYEPLRVEKEINEF